VVKAQLKETPQRADGWITEDLGVDGETVKARRKELLDASSDRNFRTEIWPDQVWERPSQRYPEGKPQAYAKRKKPVAKSKPQSEKPSQESADKETAPPTSSAQT
jgi:hypothetical protein